MAPRSAPRAGRGSPRSRGSSRRRRPCPSIDDGSAAGRAATAIAIAIRWSPPDPARPPSRPPPADHQVAPLVAGVHRRGRAGPRRWRRAGRSPSPGAPPRPRNHESAAGMDRQRGQYRDLVDHERKLVGLDPRWRRARRTARPRSIPTGSPTSVTLDRARVTIPIRAITSRKRSRLGLRPTPVIEMPEPVSAAAAIRNAAEDGSPGTRPVEPARAGSARTRTSASSRSTGAPSASSARSVWSRVAAGSRTDVVPSAASPGEQDRALHLRARNLRRRSDPPCSAPPRSTTGAWPSVVSTDAPIARSGAATRSIGRTDRLGSPVRVEAKGDAASTPHSSRIEVPELPQSRVPALSIEPHLDRHPQLQAAQQREPQPLRSTWNRHPRRGNEHRRAKTSSEARAFGETLDKTRRRRANVEGRGKSDETARALRRRREDEPSMGDGLVSRDCGGPLEPSAGSDHDVHREITPAWWDRSRRPTSTSRRRSGGVGGDGEVHRASTALGGVDDLEVLDVDAPLPQDGGDPGECAGFVRDLDLPHGDPGSNRRLGGRVRAGLASPRRTSAPRPRHRPPRSGRARPLRRCDEQVDRRGHSARGSRPGCRSTAPGCEAASRVRSRKPPAASSRTRARQPPRGRPRVP